VTPEPLRTGLLRALASTSTCICGEVTLPKQADPRTRDRWLAEYHCRACWSVWFEEVTV